MAKISVKLESYVGSDGRSLLRALLSHNSRTIKFKEIAHVKPRDWDKQKKMIKSSSSDFTKNEIFKILDTIEEYKKSLRKISLEQNLNKYSVKELRKELLKELEGSDEEKSFIEIIDECFPADKCSKSYLSSVTTTKHWLLEYKADEKVKVSHVNAEFLEELETFMKKCGNKVNSIAVTMRNIRTACNYAIKKGLLSYESYPFRDYKIKTEKTVHRTIEVEDLRKLLNYDGTGSENRARDLFFLSLYLRGMNFKDFLYLSKKDVYNNRIYYSRSKTNADINVLIEPEAQRLFDKYAGKKYLLYFMEVKEAEIRKRKTERKSEPHADVVNNATKRLKSIFKKLDINVNVGTYFARHTWATLARKFGDYDIVQQGLGHSDGRVTAIYIKYDDEVIDETNRKVIDYVCATK
ncbi:MAG: site-specific integrase [Bacteroidales bacterium]|jgi:integrase|nr:site-specific integrase [Bacteroidales bacterium]